MDLKYISVFGFLLGSLIIMGFIVWDTYKRGDWAALPFYLFVTLYQFRAGVFKLSSHPDPVSGLDVLGDAGVFNFFKTDIYFFFYALGTVLSGVLYLFGGQRYIGRWIAGTRRKGRSDAGD